MVKKAMAISRRHNPEVDVGESESPPERRHGGPGRGLVVLLGLLLVLSALGILSIQGGSFEERGIVVVGKTRGLNGDFPVYGDAEKYPHGRPGEKESIGKEAIAIKGWPPAHDEDDYCKSTTDSSRQRSDWAEAKARGITAVMFTCRPYFDDQLVSLSNVALTTTSKGHTKMTIFGISMESPLGRRLKAWLKPHCRWEITKTPPWRPWGKLVLDFRPNETFPSQPTATCTDRILDRNIQISSVAYPDNTFHVHNNFLIPLFADFLLSGLNRSNHPNELWLKDWPFHRGKTIKIYDLLGALFPRIRKYSEVVPSQGGVCIGTQLVWPQDSSKCIYYNNVAPWGNDLFWRGIVSAYQHQVFVSLKLKSYWKPTEGRVQEEPPVVYPLVNHERLAIDFDAPLPEWDLPKRPRILWTTRETTVRDRHIDRRSISALAQALENLGATITMIWPETFGRFTIREWMVKLQETDIIIGPFGSGLANVVYMRPGTQLVDFATTNHPFNPDFLAMARHSRVGYFCTDMRQFPRNHEGGVVLPDELIRPLADEVMANYELERQRPQPRLQDPIDLCDGGKNVFTQCKRPSGWHLADYQTVMTPFSSSRCYYQHRGPQRKCYGVAHLKKKECIFDRPHPLCGKP